MLYREENTVVDLRTQPPKGLDDLAVAQHKGDAGSGKVVGFGQGVVLHPHLLGPLIGQEGLPLQSVKDDVGVGVVVKDDDIVGLGKGDELVVELIRSSDAYRVGGIGYHHHLGSVCQFWVHSVQIGKVAVLLLQRVVDDFCPTQGWAHLKDGVARVRHQHHIPGVTQSPADVGQPLLGAVDALDLLRGQFHPIAAAVPALHRLDHLR